MNPLFKKLNIKDQDRVLVLNSPAEFEPHLEDLKTLLKVSTRANIKEVTYVLLFAVSQKELNVQFDKIKDKLIGDAMLWICFPKKSSKKYKSDINRDEGWAEIGKANFEPVKIVAIDEDWSALRFRKVAYIKTLKRNDKMLISRAGRNKKKTS